MTEHVLNFEGVGLEVENPDEQEQFIHPRTEDGRVLNTGDWLEFQVEHGVRYLHRMLEPDPQLHHQPKISDLVHDARERTVDLLDTHPHDVLGSTELSELLENPEARAIMEDWNARFGPLFRHACKNGKISVDSVSTAFLEYQESLVADVYELRRLLLQFTGRYPDVSEVLPTTYSRVLAPGETANQGQQLSYATALPYVRIAQHKDGSAQRLRDELDNEQSLLAQPNDPFVHPVEGSSTLKRRLVNLLDEDGKSMVLLDSRPSFRHVDMLRIYRSNIKRLVGAGSF